MPPFKFKHFAVNHDHSSMKVGVDGVLIGCWAEAENPHTILDVGSGCGLIALIMAQRYPNAGIIGIDVDKASVEEAIGNVASSPWPDRVKISEKSFSEEFCLNLLNEYMKFDLIVSNPPYFNAGVTNAVTPREVARHQGVLSPAVIFRLSGMIISKGGSVAMVVPHDESEDLEKCAISLGYVLKRKCLVRGHDKAPWKRVLLQWQYGKDLDIVTEITNLTLETSPGIPTDEYRALCKDFYLKF